MTAVAGPWKGTIGPTTVCYALSREDAQKQCDASRLVGLVFVTHETSGERWIRDPERGWRPFVPVQKRKGLEVERWPSLKYRADIDG